MMRDHRLKSGIKIAGLLIMAGVVLLCNTAGVSAYFTDTDSSTNTFTVGKVTIEHHEDEWEKLPPEEKEDITPNKEFKKDPAIKNTGDNGSTDNGDPDVTIE